MKPFEIRGFNPCESLLRHSPEQLRNFIRRMKTLRMNTIIIHYDYGWKRYQELILEECEKAGIDIILMTFGPRTFFSYSDWKNQWFAKDEAGVPFTEHLECETYPCRFEEEALQAFEYGACQWLKELPPAIKHVHMRGADGIMFCECPKCRVLPEYERWQPFVERFTKAVLETRPDLKFETDVYVKRLYIPENRKPFENMTHIMFDTFNRHNEFPLRSAEFQRKSNGLSVLRSAGIEPDTVNSNRFLFNRLGEWAEAFPGKPYIHENAMGQSYFTTFQYATDSYLQDVKLYQELGLKGICWEAYEPGYNNFAEMFEILAKAAMGEEVHREPSPMEKAHRQHPDPRFGGDLSFPLEKYIDDPWQLKHKLLFRRFWLAPDFEIFREFLEFAFEYEGKLDFIYTGSIILKNYYRNRIIKYASLEPEEKDFLTRRKLWDFMEDIPSSQDPRKVCKNLIETLFRKAEKA